jgi:hypothetical protein
MKTAPFFLVAPLALLAACGGASHSLSDNPPSKTQERPGTPTVDCDEIFFDIESMKARGHTLPFVWEGKLVQPMGPLYYCQSETVRNGVRQSVRREGWMRLHVSSSLSRGGRVEFPEPEHLQLPVYDEDIGFGEIQALLQTLGATVPAGHEPVVSTNNFYRLGLTSYVVMDGIDLSEATLEPYGIVNGRHASSINVRGPQAFLIQQRLLAGASLDLVSFRQSSFSDTKLPLVLSHTIRANAPILPMTKIPAAEFLSQVWSRHASGDDPKIIALSTARFFLLDEQIKSGDFESRYPGLQAMQRYAEQRWRRDPQPLATIDIHALRLLETLNALDERLHFYIAWDLKLQDLFSSNSFDALRAAMAWHKQSASLDDAQREFVLSFALVLKGQRQSDAWTKARSEAERLRYDRARLDMLSPTLAWMQSYSGPNFSGDEAFAESLSLAAQPDFDGAKLSDLKLSYEWIRNYRGPSESDARRALSSAKELVFSEAWKAGSLQLVKDSFEWLTSYSGPSLTRKAEAFAKTRDYVLGRRMNEKQFEQLKSVFDREQRRLRDKALALARAEREVFGS